MQLLLCRVNNTAKQGFACLQVLHALLPILCSSDSSQQLQGARQFVIDQIGGHVCIQGVFQVRDCCLIACAMY